MYSGTGNAEKKDQGPKNDSEVFQTDLQPIARKHGQSQLTTGGWQIGLFCLMELHGQSIPVDRFFLKILGCQRRCHTPLFSRLRIWTLQPSLKVMRHPLKHFCERRDLHFVAFNCPNLISLF
jgi:hypothetical protein